MRDLAILGVLVALLPFALSNVAVSYLAWCWTAIIALDNYTFGVVQDLRVNFIFAIITIFGLAVSKKTRENHCFNSPTTVLMVLFAIQATLSMAFAYAGNPLNFERYLELIKTLVFCFCMPLVVFGRTRIHALVLVLVLGLGFHGLVEGLKVIVSAGGHHVVGARKFGDNNHFAVALAMVTPLMLYIFLYSKNRLVIFGAFGGLLLNVFAIIGTHSRGGFLCMAAAGLTLVIAGRRKMLALFVVVLGGLIVSYSAPDSWSERMQTIKEAGGDTSFMQRVDAWQVSSAIALRNPLLGGGFMAVQAQPVWDRFIGDRGLLGFVDTYRSERARAAHSIYFQVLGDLGFSGLFIFLGLIGRTFYVRNQIKRIARNSKLEITWAADLSDSLAATMVAYIVGGAAVSLAYFEVVYIMVMLMEVLKREAQDASRNITTDLGE